MLEEMLGHWELLGADSDGGAAKMSEAGGLSSAALSIVPQNRGMRRLTSKTGNSTQLRAIYDLHAMWGCVET